jgi:hypothetical protein
MSAGKQVRGEAGKEQHTVPISVVSWPSLTPAYPLTVLPPYPLIIFR